MSSVKLGPGEQAAIKKVIDEDVPELSEDEEASVDEAFARDGEMFPQRWYNAGPGSPQERILLKGGRILEPTYGYYVIHTPEELTILLNALPGRVWKEDLPADAPDLECPRGSEQMGVVCGMRTRSSRAFNVHMARNHPRR
ncbi:MAG: hypothetical protein WBA46_08600 [Thermomicrobiales bacterium]